jgi:uncharacterized membrane protein YraQ (UPF0718 family)
MTESQSYQLRVAPLTGLSIFLVIAAVGLFLVKWSPYYQRVFVAAANHSIGHSILMGTAAQAPPASWNAALDYALAYGKAIWQAMVLGLILGSAVEELLPRAWIARFLGRSGLRSVAAGGLLAIPGMMCTCCAAPVVIGLRRSEASAGASMAFWLGNTVLNPATLIFMGFVLGWQWTGLRLALGVPLVFGTGYLVSRFAGGDALETAQQDLRQALAADQPGPSLSRWLTRLATMAMRLVPEYLVLVLILGASRAWLFPQIGPAIDNGLPWIIAMAAAGLLFVIPTAGEVPIVQAMLALGMGSGPAGALMMTLAPISLPSLVMTGKVFSWRLLGLVTGLVLLAGIAAGCLAAVLHF